MNPSETLPRRADLLKVTRLRGVLWAAAAAALVSLGLEYGFEQPPLPIALLNVVQLAAIVIYVGAQVAEIVQATSPLAALRRRWFDALLIVGCAVILLAEAETTGQPVLKASTVYVATLQIVLVARFALGVVRFNLALSERRLRPGRMMVGSFAVVIVLGAVLLALPKATSPELRHEEAHYFTEHLVNCLFTSVSATCVTGLTVFENTGRDFSRFGQVVILCLIQAGGLGIMIYGGLFGLLLGRQLSLRHSLALQDALSHRTLGHVRHMVWFVVVVTLLCEAGGAALLYSMWPAEVGPASERVFHSVFHAVSAFCNAGFSLQADSLVEFRGAWQVYGCVMPLIVIGGLGFPVLTNLFDGARARFRRVRGATGADGIRLPHSRNRTERTPLTLHTKLVLSSTILLIAVPTVAFFVIESIGASDGQNDVAGLLPPAMADLPWHQRISAAFFQAVTTRTAGFNTTAQDPASLSPASTFLTMLLMFVGGSPASTAGGVKTVSVTILALGVYSTLRGRSEVEGFARTIPQSAVRRSAVIVMVMFCLVGAVTLMLCVTEQGESLGEVLFESVSACGTVGLSTGLTPRLTIPGRVIIMLAMFAGRIGPLTLLVALSGGAAPGRYEYPQEHPVIC
ncbi:MAG: hypothetical protein GY842_11160 [bacterium]|nr:hypothetical protein [bacterium]